MEPDKIYLLEIYDDAGDYEGPNPLHVTCLGFVHGPERARYCVLQPLPSPDTAPIQLAIRPHYEADKIDRIIESVCTVSISTAREGVTFTPDERYGFADFVFWKVGKIHPPNEA